jgi:hypothetical protein
MYSLKNLNIENLFSSSTTVPTTNGKFDINTLFKNNGENKFEFNPTTLLNRNKKRKLNLETTFFNIFKECCKSITSANDIGLTDLFYNVPPNIIECIDYDTLKCMQYLQIELEKYHISSLIMENSKNKLFITWNNLEEKLTNNNLEEKLTTKSNLEEN